MRYDLIHALWKALKYEHFVRTGHDDPEDHRLHCETCLWLAKVYRESATVPPKEPK